MNMKIATRAPTVGATVVSARMWSGAGNAPAFSSSASFFALLASKRPVISPEDPISELMTGAEMSCPSRMMASWRPRSDGFLGPWAL